MSVHTCATNATEAFQKIAAPTLFKKTFLETQDATISYGYLSEAIKKMTFLYRLVGLCAGDRVLLSCRDDAYTSILFISLVVNGITAVNIDPETKPIRARHLFETTRPKGLILDIGLKEQWQLEKPSFFLEIKKEEGSLFQKLLGKKTETKNSSFYPAVLKNIQPCEIPSSLDPELDAYILFTSGSTSDPKGVQITHKNLFSHLATLSRQFGYTPSSRLLDILPFSHADGMIQGAMAAFVNQASVYRPMEFQIQKLHALVDSIYKYRITHFITAPTMLALIDQFCVSDPNVFKTEDFRFIISTSAYLDANLWKNVEEHFQTRIANVYGLTETVAGGLFSGPGDHDHRVGTVGKPVDCEARIVDDRDRDVKPGESGELLIKGDSVMKGYWNAPEATSQVLRDGWLYTGDIARVDENGFYQIVGRKKNMIICGGLNVHPEEVTEVLKRAPEVEDAVTFGVEDKIWGEQVVSAVCFRQNAKISEQALIASCRNHLEENKIPKKIHILPSLPKTPVGKVRIEEVKKIIAENTNDENTREADIRQHLEKQIIQIAASCFKVLPETLSLDTTPDRTTGWNSLSHLEFIAALENHFHVAFSPLEIMQSKKLGDVWKIITEKI